MVYRSFRNNCRGQVLVVSGLIVALLLLSTAFYVIEVSKSVPKVEANDAISFDGYKPCLRSTLVSALANASAGGDPDVLATDLEQLKTVVLAHSYDALLTIDFVTITGDGYVNGLFINWDTSGSAVSAAYASCELTAKSNAAQSTATYTFNVSTQLSISGSYQQENETQKQVILAVSVLNEGESALAQSFVFSYYNGTDWATADSPIVVDYGDGSYAVSFSAVDTPENEPLNVSVLCVDTRGITVGASATCNHI